MAIGLPVLGDGWVRIEIGELGVPHGVDTFKLAT